VLVCLRSGRRRRRSLDRRGMGGIDTGNLLGLGVTFAGMHWARQRLSLAFPE
jgi:hypothetical protein